jgi:hypothetical protein
LSVQTGVR